MEERSLPEYNAGDIVPFHLSPGIVVASFFVSLTGAITTVELLHRRPSAKGWPNWLHLAACAISMGLIAIWCMHYVGNRAILLADGEDDMQLIYNPGWTALSSFIPTIALFVSFTIADRRYKGNKSLLVCLIVSGIVAGLATVGMHYTGNLGVSNYYIHFDPRYVVGAIVIACLACVGALTLIFMLQDLWLNILPWRILGAITIAGAVSGMHFEASMGTSYELQHQSLSGNSSSRDTNVIIAIVLSLLTIPVCLGIAVSTNRRKKQLADRAQQVVLACVRFDPDGRLMITHEGLLPSQNITAKDNQRSFQDEFKESHPAFQWIFKVSHHWSSISRWLPQMRQHLKSANFDNRNLSRKRSPSDTTMREGNPADDEYSVLFRESFCVAAADLASDLREQLDELGTLYDRVMMTGTLGGLQPQCQMSLLQALRMRPSPTDQDSETSIGTEILGRGQLLFLVRQVHKQDEVSRFLALGYRFVPIDKISEHLAKKLQVSVPHLTSNLANLRAYVNRPPGSAPVGTLLGCFALRAGISRRNWDVLVRKDFPFRLPCVQLSTTQLGQAEIDTLSELDGTSVANCLARLAARTENVHDEFAVLFKQRLSQLCEIVKEPFFRQAIFSAKIVQVPTCDPRTNLFSRCSLVAFHIIPDVHVSSLKSSPALVYSPLSFFRCRQQILEGHRHETSLDRRIHYEFASLFGSKAGTHVAHPSPSMVRRLQFSAGSKLGVMLHRLSRLGPKSTEMSELSDHVVRYRTDSPDSLEGQNYINQTRTRHMSLPFGGIMVSSDVTVETSSLKNLDDDVVVQVEDIGTSGHAGIAETECTTYVDELYAMAVSRWQRT